ncbi:MAG: peptidase [Zetaproteobacteria bacterium]|nr:peptidase [Pseudobdellovibrionaceae bacterium]
MSKTIRIKPNGQVKRLVFFVFLILPITSLGKSIDGSGLEQEIFGYADIHTHLFANLAFGGKFFEGKPFDEKGIEEALSYSSYSIFDRLIVRVAELALGDGPNGKKSDRKNLGNWSQNDQVNRQTMYYEWIERSFRGGLRLLVIHAVNNEVLCKLVPKEKKSSCNDMVLVDRQIEAAYDLQDYIDRQAGGKGLGWFRIVKSSREARDVIKNGKLAVVLGIEVDSLFDCKLEKCNFAEVEKSLLEYKRKGVSHVFPVHLFDNGFSGAAIYQTGVLTLGNLLGQGQLFKARDCSAEGIEFKITSLGKFDGHCNSRGLSDFGRSFLTLLMKHKMIIDTDHMSKYGIDQALNLAEDHNYPLVSSHTGFLDIAKGSSRAENKKTEEQTQRILQLGGMVAPIFPKTSQKNSVAWGKIDHNCDYSIRSWAQSYLYAKDKSERWSLYPSVAFGSDLNGMITMPSARFGEKGCGGNAEQVAEQRNPVEYPFISYDGSISFNRLQIGKKAMDINFDGMSNVGMIPDFIADMSNIGMNEEDLAPLFRSAEGFIKMWEKVEATEI